MVTHKSPITKSGSTFIMLYMCVYIYLPAAPLLVVQPTSERISIKRMKSLISWQACHLSFLELPTGGGEQA